MAMLPRMKDGHLCVPWWYVLGYPFYIAGIIAVGGIEMDPELTTIALLVCSVLGAAAYIVLGAIAKYEKQRTDAAQLKSKIAANGRDPDNLEQLTPAERWEIKKAQKFDKIFLIADAVAIIMASAFSYAVIHYFGADYLTPGAWEEYAVAGIAGGIIAALFIDKTVMQWIAAGLWEVKTAKAFQLAAPVIEEVIAKAAPVSKYDELVQSYIGGGFSSKKAKKMAEDYIANHPECLKAPAEGPEE